MFGKGKIDVTIQKTYYTPGDTISGNVVLTLKKPVKARELSISLIGEGMAPVTQSTTTTQRSGIASFGGPIFGGPTSTTVTTKLEPRNIYDFKQKLDGEKEYSQGGEYRFEIKIPADILSMRQQMMAIIPSQPIKWYLLAKLDIPGGLDITKKVDITIG